MRSTSSTTSRQATPTLSGGVGPAAADQLAVPAQQGRRGDQEDRPPVARQQLRQPRHAVESWIRRLRDTVSVGIGLHQAIATSRRYAPPQIAGEVGDLVARLQAGWNIRDALLRFGDDLDDSAGDQVVASLLLHATDRSEHLTDVLTGIADTAAKEVGMRQVVEANAPNLDSSRRS